MGGLAQGGGVFGERPLIDADGGDVATAGAEGREEILIGPAVFLDGDAAFGAIGNGGHELAPGVGRGDGDGPGDAPFAEDGLGLGTAGGDGNPLQFFGEGAGAVVGGEDGIDRAGADAGEEDHHVELIPAEAVVEGEDVGIIGNGDFAHGGRDEGFAALFANEDAHLVGAARFERENFQTVKAHA